MAIEITQPGLFTTVQDQGRTGYYHLGLPQGGALDQYSYALANALVGNTNGEAVLECAYTGPTFTVKKETVAAVTGAPVELKVNGKPQTMWTRFELSEGDEVSFGMIKAGTRYFIAFA